MTNDMGYSISDVIPNSARKVSVDNMLLSYVQTQGRSNMLDGFDYESPLASQHLVDPVAGTGEIHRDAGASPHSAASLTAEAFID